MEELLEQEIKEFRQVILTINSIPNPSEEEKRSTSSSCQKAAILHLWR